jgi:fimbrial chaperone protein
MGQRWIFKAALRVLGPAVVFAMAVASAQAATFSVDPVIVTLKQGNSSSTLSITNQSPQLLRLQVTGFAWVQSPAGEMQLTPSDELVFFPQLISLAAGETRRVRVGSSVELHPKEQAFRLFMEELPALQSITQPGGAVLTLRMRIGVPVFVSPAGAPVIAGEVDDAAVRSGTLAFDVANTGNTHFSVQSVHLVAKNAAGGTIFTDDLTGWYVLAGTLRHYTVALTKERCTALHSVAVNVKADAVSFSKIFTGFPKDCGSGLGR